MSDKTGIEWADATWSPLVGCTKVSPGCDHCYAETFVNRFAGTKGFPERFDTVVLRGDRFVTQPLRWKKPRRVFVNSLSDLFHPDVPDEFVARVFAVMAAAPQHTFQLLTKRHGRMRSLLSWHWLRITAEEFAAEHDTGTGVRFQWPLPNVWLGVSVEDQKHADLRVPVLLDTPAAVRWISAEPLLGPVRLHRYLREPVWGEGAMNSRVDGLDWVVVGGESGAGARPMDPRWARALREDCATAGVPFLFKQWGNHDATGRRVSKHVAGRELDGRLHDGYPEAAA